MPAIEKVDLRTKAVLWPSTGLDNDGEHTHGSPVEIMSRWELGRREIIGPDGSPRAVDGAIQVDREIATGSLLWKGELADVSDASGLMSVEMYTEVPDDRGRHFFREVAVVRAATEPPT